MKAHYRFAIYSSLVLHAAILVAVLQVRSEPAPQATQSIHITLSTPQTRPDSLRPVQAESRPIHTVVHSAAAGRVRRSVASTPAINTTEANLTQQVLSSEPNPITETTAPPRPAAASTVASDDSQPDVVAITQEAAAYLNNPAPIYPASALARLEHGTVLVRVTVSAVGLPMDVHLAQSSGSKRLDQAALTAVQGWRFSPAKRGNIAIEAVIKVPVIFNLPG